MKGSTFENCVMSKCYIRPALYFRSCELIPDPAWPYVSAVLLPYCYVVYVISSIHMPLVMRT